MSASSSSSSSTARPQGPVPAQRLATPVRSRRRPAITIAGVLLVVTAAGAGGAVYLNSGDSVRVLAVAKAVQAGDQLSTADLTYVLVDEASAGQALRSGAVDQVVGQYAAVPLLPGQILVPGAVTDALAPPAGYSVVGLPLEPGQMPTTALQAGDPVLIVSTPAQQDAPPRSEQPDSMKATVVSLDPVVDTDKVVLNVQVSQAQAAMLAARAATGRISVVQLPGQG